jgi:maltose-binding protein MalE
MKTMRLISKFLCIALLGLTALAGLAGCGAKTVTLTGAEKDAVLAYGEAMTDNLMEGMNAADYATFSKDFSDAMKEGIPETGFASMLEKITGKIGAYESRVVSSVEQSGDYVAVIYAAKFEQDEPVTVRVVFEIAEPHRIAGLWFDSEKLRK